jgi:hypothetical protein
MICSSVVDNKKAADIINQTGIFANGTEKKNQQYFWVQIYIKEEQYL